MLCVSLRLGDMMVSISLNALGGRLSLLKSLIGGSYFYNRYHIQHGKCLCSGIKSQDWLVSFH